MDEPPADFTWRDGERVVRFGPGALEEAVSLAGGPGYALLSTERALAAAPAVADAAAARHLVPPGRVDEVAAGLRDAVRGERLVALGGGRVIDTAKALTAADPPRRVVAIPTTLSGAEMTTVHRHAAGVPFETPRVRPAVVVSDPALVASQPADDLAASAANALAHAVEAPLTRLANPVATLAAREAARLLLAAFGLAGGSGGGTAPSGAGTAEPDRHTLALGALLAGYAIDSAHYGVHHVVSQTVVRLAGVGHGPANAIVLPAVLAHLARVRPDGVAALAAAVGGDPVELAAALRDRTGTSRLRDLGVEEDALGAMADEAAARPDVGHVPPTPSREDLLTILRAAF